MSKYVVKFGGTSLKDADAINRAFGIVNDFYEKKKPEQMVVVVSAAGKVGDRKLEDKITNLLENIHHSKNAEENRGEIASRVNKLCGNLGIECPIGIYADLDRAMQNNQKNDKSYSSIVSIGEKLSVFCVDKFFEKKGIEAKTFDFNEFGMISNKYKEATATEDATVEIEKRLNGRKGIIIVPGFLGYNEKGEVTTLGRDGSNYTATKIGEAILANDIYIFSDESGVRRANPQLVPDAEILEELTYNEAVEFGELGAKIINAKAIGPARNENIPVHIVDECYQGTKISSSISLEHMGAKIIASSPKHYIITVKYETDKPGVLAEISDYFKEAGINIESIADERHALSIAFLKNEGGNLESLLKNLGNEYNLNLENSFARISLIGEGMRNQVGVLSRMASVYNNKGVSFEMISQSLNQLNITTFIKQEHERIAVKGLYYEFFRNHRS